MDHLVTFKTAEGRDGNHTAKSLEEALSFVERLRNTEEANEVRVFRMKEVPIEFRAYYKVEVRAESATSENDEEESEKRDEPRPALASAASGAGSANGEHTADASRRLFHRS